LPKRCDGKASAFEEFAMKMNCAEFEIRLADLIDGTLPSDQRPLVDAHIAECAACAALATDASAVTSLISRATAVDPPAAMVNKILFEATHGLSRAETKPSWFSRLFGPMVQPRLAMGMAMTVLSIFMLGRQLEISGRQLTNSDFGPSRVWTVAENRVQRIWDRIVKEYEDLRFVYEVQTQLREWSDEAPETERQNGNRRQ
jgi:hypothetical protein